MPNVTAVAFNPPRHFRLWDAHISFAQVLFRSPCCEELKTNYDIKLWGIEYLDTRWEFKAAAIEPPTAGDLSRIQTRLQKPVRAENILVIRSTTGKRYYIVAARWMLDEFEGVYWAPSLTYMPSPIQDAGKRPKWDWD